MKSERKKETEHKAKKMLPEYAEIHISNSTKFKSAKKRILLTISTKSLFAADVGYQRFLLRWV